MVNGIAVIVLLSLLAAAGGAVFKAKKSGRKCIGCPYAGSCGKGCGS